VLYLKNLKEQKEIKTENDFFLSLEQDRIEICESLRVTQLEKTKLQKLLVIHMLAYPQSLIEREQAEKREILDNEELLRSIGIQFKLISIIGCLILLLDIFEAVLV
jgi:hypothetical protein